MEGRGWERKVRAKKRVMLLARRQTECPCYTDLPCVLDFAADWIGVAFCFVFKSVGFFAHHQCTDGPAGEGFAIPGAPAAFCLLVGVADRAVERKVDQGQIGVEALDDAAFVFDAPNFCRCVAHPGDDLFDRAATTVDLVQHQGQVVFDRRKA